MYLGPLLGLYLQTFVVQFTRLALSAIIFVIVYGRMVEIYLMVSLSLIHISRTLNEWHSPYPQLAGEVRAAVSDLAAPVSYTHLRCV